MTVDEYSQGFRNRTSLLLGPDALRLLDGKTVGIAGCGGVGGAAAIMLARLGVGGFILADPGVFDPPDLNRQWGASCHVLGQNKAVTYEAILRDINPAVRVRTYTEGVTERTMDDIVAASDYLVDCLDVSVSVPLRLRMYDEAHRRGIYCVTSPIFGFGTLLIQAAPGGMSLAPVIDAILAELRRSQSLPPGIGTRFHAEHVAQIQANIGDGVASVAMAPALGASLACTEAVLALLGKQTPGLREPICLPRMLLAEMVQPRFQIVDCRDILPDVPVPTVRVEVAESEAERRRALAAVGYQTPALPRERVALDLLTDSFSEAPAPRDAPRLDVSADEIVTRLQAVYPYRHIELTHRGRFAEALLTEALVRPGARVLGLALFPTLLHHLTVRGATVTEIGQGAMDLDLGALEAELGSGDVAAVFLELSNNALGGKPLSLATLERAHAIARARKVPLVVDACRAFTNAAQLEALGEVPRGEGLHDLVREVAKHSDACTVSLSKDFPCRVGGLVGVHDEHLAGRVRLSSRIMYGVEVPESSLADIWSSVRPGPELDIAIRRRQSFTRSLGLALSEMGVPLVGDAGAHAIFVDAAVLLPGVAAEHHPADTLAAELFALGGIRCARNLVMGDTPVVRLAVRTDLCAPEHRERVLASFRALLERRGQLRGLRSAGPSDSLGGRLEPV